MRLVLGDQYADLLRAVFVRRPWPREDVFDPRWMPQCRTIRRNSRDVLHHRQSRSSEACSVLRLWHDDSICRDRGSLRSVLERLALASGSRLGCSIDDLRVHARVRSFILSTRVGTAR